MKYLENCRALAGIVLLAALLAPAIGKADDSELFTTRVIPNVLLLIDKSGSMDFPSGSTGIGNLDGRATNSYGPVTDTRMDVLYKVVYTLLNADKSIPPGGGGSSVVTYTCKLRGTGTGEDGDSKIKAGVAYTQFSIKSCEPESPGVWSTIVSGDTVTIGEHDSESVIINGSGTCAGGEKKCVFFPSQTFKADHKKNEPVTVSHTVAGGGYKYVFPYPGPASRVPAATPTTDERAQAIGAYSAVTQLSGEDEKILKARIGLMTFSGTTVSNSDIKIWAPWSSSANVLPFSATSGYRYFDVWAALKNTLPGGGTPTAKALDVAKNWFTDTTSGAYRADDYCRPNYVILITDGEDTYGYNLGGPGNAGSYIGGGGAFNSDGSGVGQVSRNNDVITWAKNLYDNTTKITLYAVGVGMPQVAPSPLPGGLPAGSITTQSLRMLRDVLRRAAEQKGETSTITGWNTIGNAGSDNTSRGAGRAFFANDATELATALGNVFQQILAGEYSFTAPTVASVRTTDRNYLFLGSFQPNSPPQTQWRGHLDAYTINSIDNTQWRWDAETPLTTVSDANRRMCTSTASGTRANFTTSIDNNLLGVDTTRRTTVVEYVRGLASGGRTYKAGDPAWKLGDIFHSKPALVGPPSLFYQDAGYSNTSQGGSTSFLQAKIHRTRVVYAGSNDGALHAFWAGDWDTGAGSYGYGDGREMFAYVPNLLLNKLDWMVPGANTSHGYYVDSSPRIADVWLDTDNNNLKESTEWKTVLISGLRGGGSGYFALDITNPPSGTSTDSIGSGGYASTAYPIALWEFDNTAILGESWSEPYITKVKIRNQDTGTADQTAVRDRWVAIFGGGKSDEGQGRTLVVLDIQTGTPLKVFDNVAGITGDIVASPTAVLDGGGYLRYVYVPDLSGNLYKFDFRQTGTVSTGLGEWSVVKRFSPSQTGAQRAFHRAEVAVVTDSERWIYFGTGNQEYPITDNGTGKFFGIHDIDGSTPALITDNLLTAVHANMNVASASTTVAVGASGWKIDLSLVPANSFDTGTHSGEKVLSDPVVFNNNVFFTTYTATATNPCAGSGIARIYGVNQLTAGAAMSADTRFGESGSGVVSRHATSSLGVASSPTLSVNPSGESSIFIGFSGLPGGTGTSREITVPSPSKMKNLKDWKEIL